MTPKEEAEKAHADVKEIARQLAKAGFMAESEWWSKFEEASKRLKEAYRRMNEGDDNE